MTVVLPNASTAGRLLTIAFRFAISRTPDARTTVTRAGRPSGIAATARATDARNMYTVSCPLTRPLANVNIAARATKIERIFPKRSICTIIGKSAFTVLFSSCEILLISVRSPVDTTSASARPRTTRVPEKVMFVWSAGISHLLFRASVRFRTGCDSPVRIDSSTKRSFANIRRASAETMSPA